VLEVKGEKEEQSPKKERGKKMRRWKEKRGKGGVTGIFFGEKDFAY